MQGHNSKQLFINGRFLGKPITGTQRFAREILFSLDRILAASHPDLSVSVIAPKGTARPSQLKSIKFDTYGSKQGHAWEQFDLSRAARSGFLLNLEASGVLFKRQQLTVIHDAAVYRKPQNFSFAYSTWHRIMGFVLSHVSRIATVSTFSKKELSSILGVSPKKISVIYNGHEHILQNKADSRVLDRLGVRTKAFFLFVGSPVPNKNLARAIEAFASLKRSDVSFLIVGAAKGNVFNGAVNAVPENVILPGRLTDEEIVALYKEATALVFPSLYEGFGIPPLEAMVLGCPVLASRIPPVEEVCAEAALYFDPLDVKDMAAKMQEVLDSPSLRGTLIEKGTARYTNFSWKESASRLLGAIGTQSVA